ncbi:zinc finger protein 135-like isoform X4 [Dermacentor albipictus]|uniref:zinc finger protein 135-like isoform X4 n=1 Tax=Dermacentor albipictus TaxID=60249 RepID=UPI0038FC7EFB
MTEQRSGGQTPPPFAFIEEATPGTSREGGEGASGTCDDIPAYIDEYINDALKAWKRQTNATDVDDATDSGSTNYASVVSTASAVHAWPRTSHAGIEKLSSTTRDTASCSEEAWRCQLNAQHRPIADQTYSLDGAYSSGSPSLLQLGPTSSIDHKKPSTSRAGMVEASASLQYGARNPQTTRVQQSNTQYYTTARTSTIEGYAHNRHTGSTSFTLPVYSSSGGGKYAVASTSHAGSEEASGILGNGARIPDATGAEPWGTHYYAASGTTTVYDVSCSRSTTCLHLESTSSIDHTLPSTSCAGMMEASASLQYDASSQYNAYEQHACVPEAFRMETFPQRDLPSANEAITPQKSWSSQHTSHSSMFADHFQGHANSTGSGSAGFTLPVYSSSSGGGSDDSVACTSHAGMQEASGMSGNETRNATRSGGRGHQQLSGVSGNVSSRRDALRGHDNQHTGDTAPICKARDQSSVKLSEFVECCRIRDAKKHECEICGKLFHRARHLDVHKRTHTGEKPYNCEICGASFARNWALSRHQVTHTDEKPHVCHKCSKSFKAKRYLKDHLKSCCRKGAFICEKCDESFIDNSHLRHHYARVHGHIILPE